MNAFVSLKHDFFDRHDHACQLKMVAQRVVNQESHADWIDVVGGFEDDGAGPIDFIEAGKLGDIVGDDLRLTMREDDATSFLSGTNPQG